MSSPFSDTPTAKYLSAPNHQHLRQGPSRSSASGGTSVKWFYQVCPPGRTEERHQTRDLVIIMSLYISDLTSTNIGKQWIYIHIYIYTIIVTICYKHIYIYMILYDIIWYHHWSHKAWSHRPRVVARITLSSLQPSKSLRVAISGTTAWPAPWAPAARSKGPRVRLSTKYLVCPVTLQGYTTINRHIIWRMTCISWTYPWHTVCGTRKGPRYKLPP